MTTVPPPVAAESITTGRKVSSLDGTVSVAVAAEGMISSITVRGETHAVRAGSTLEGTITLDLTVKQIESGVEVIPAALTENPKIPFWFKRPLI